MAMFIVKPWYRKKDAIYGAEWAGTSDPSWTRTDAAVGFADPNPYYSGMSDSPSSPFDNIMPWSGMRRVTDASAGELVEIPKFYYKWTRDGVKMKLQISMSPFDGSYVSPAHADRGDGVGERDYVYVGRYHCASGYKSKTGVTPKGASKSTFVSGIHNLRSDVWMIDYATYWTICLLYLVEYANWNSQSKIGVGGDQSKPTGQSDNMPYHTGTIQSNRNQLGVGVQYRYIEDLWGNVWDWCNGVTPGNNSIYVTNTPNGSPNVYVASNPRSSGYIKSWSINSISGYEYALWPNNVSGTDQTYICDYYEYNSTGYGGGALAIGYSGNSLTSGGLFRVSPYWSGSESVNYIGSRLMVLPPSRLSA